MTMTKHKYLTTVALALMTLTACDIETSDNGDLDGFWLLSTVDTIGTGGRAMVEESVLTWSFQGRILELRQPGKGIAKNIICQFSHEGDSLHITHPYVLDRSKQDVMIDQPELLRPYGIGHTDEHYRVLGLDGGSMTLRNEEIVLKFRKF